MVESKVNTSTTAFGKQLAQAIAQQSAQAPQSAAPIVAYRSDLPSLSIGQVIQVTVRRLEVQGQERSGIEFQGKFIEAQLPKDLSNGQQLTVKVLAESNSQIVLRINQQADLVKSVDPKLEALLKILNISSEQLELLGELGTSDAPVELKKDASSIIKLLEPAIKDSLTKLIITAKELDNPKELSGLLKAFMPDSARISSAKNAISLELLSQLAQEPQNIWEQLDKQIAVVLKNIGVNMPQGNQGQTSGEIPAGSTLDPQIQKLLGALKTIGATISTSPDSFEQDVAAMLAGHSNLPEALEIRLKTVLALSLKDQALPLLVHTVDSIDTSNLGAQNDVTRAFLEFVAKFRDDLKLLIGQDGTAPYDPRVLDKLLRQTLATLISQFSEQGGEVPFPTAGVGSPLTQLLNNISADLPRQHAVALRSIEAQVRSLLSETETLIAEQSQTAVSVSKLPAFVKLLDFVQKTSDSIAQSPSPAQSQFVRFIVDLQNALKSSVSEKEGGLVNLPTLRTTLTQMLKGIESQANPLSANLPESLPQIISNVGGSQAQPNSANTGPLAETRNLPVELKGKLEQINILVRQLIQEIDLHAAVNPQLSSPAPQNNASPILEALSPGDLAKLVESNEFTSLIKLLKETALTAPRGSTSAGSEIAEFAKKLLRDLEKGSNPAESKGREPIHETLRKAQDFIRKSLAAEISINSNIEQAKRALDTVRSIENMVRTQEVLTQLTPVMRALGEPTLMLFPMFVQGLLSKLEVSLRPRLEESEEEANSKNGRKKGGGSYEKISFSLGLPALGQVGVNLAHRKSEILLDITFENQELAKFVEARLPKLEEALRRSGYKTIDIKSVAGTPGSARPDWLADLTGRPGVIA